ncbi:siderophore-interacting protein [Sphingobacterium puteale]|uniref:Siderophore-interacting protein n=1 Tax=Sphingobacterium puteale TaxID=2420510 RepID=A0A420VU10_9SPHI|nr:FAD-binding oxidoreductase [Sphingobacterium puteale]RKO69765.1 siderophore-interacting protein [Sphingobacterium puteale]
MPSAPKWVFDTLNLFIAQIPDVQVSHIEHLSTSVKRISLQGNFEKLQFSVGAFFDIRVSDTDARRYTIAEINSEKDNLKLIAHIHGHGCGSDFMDQLEIGDRIALNKPRTEQKYYDHSAEKIVFFGDETSLALACSFLPVMQAQKKSYLFLFELDAENNAVPEYLGLDNCIVFPKSSVFAHPDQIKDLPLFKNEDWSDAYFVLTGNVSSVQNLRRVIKTQTNARIKHHGYWLQGKKGL